MGESDWKPGQAGLSICLSDTSDHRKWPDPRKAVPKSRAQVTQSICPFPVGSALGIGYFHFHASFLEDAPLTGVYPIQGPLDFD